MINPKCVVVGDGGVGKTSLLVSFTTNKFPSEYVSTVFDNRTVTLSIGGEPVTVAFFDTAGQEEYDRLRPMSYTGTDVCMICFSVTSPASFENIREKWVHEFNYYCPDTPFVLVGTQVDLRTDNSTLEKLMKNHQQPITSKQGEQLARELKASKYFECSALHQTGLKALFEEVMLIAQHSASRQVGRRRKKGKSNKCEILWWLQKRSQTLSYLTVCCMHVDVFSSINV